MTALVFMILLVVIGTWNITDGIFSRMCYPNEKLKQHWVRYFRIFLGVFLIYLAWFFGVAVL